MLDLRESDKGLISKELKRLREAQLLVVSDEDEPYDRRKRFVPVDPASPYRACVAPCATHSLENWLTATP